jgi:hypothetical protein
MPGTFQTNLANVNISDTYYGVLHAGGQNLPPTGQAQIYDGYGTLAAIRVGANCNGVTICGPLSATSLTTTSKLSASTQFDIFNLLNVLHPVGSIIFTFNSNNPGTTRPGWSVTTWSQISQGRFIVGVGTGTDGRGDDMVFAAGNTVGEYEHILKLNETPSHDHIQTLGNDGGGIKATSSPFYAGYLDQVGGYAAGFRDIGNTAGSIQAAAHTNADVFYRTTITGGSEPHNNIPPGFGLYVWQRTS